MQILLMLLYTGFQSFIHHWISIYHIGDLYKISLLNSGFEYAGAKLFQIKLI